MELHEVRYFLALSQTLNFTKAAEICNVSQPALTRAIQKMEDELGGLLFSRERSNMRPGPRLYRRAVDVRFRVDGQLPAFQRGHLHGPCDSRTTLSQRGPSC